MKNRPISITIAPRTILLIFSLILLFMVMLRLTDILLLIFFSLIFAAALHPTVTWIMHRLRIGKGLAIALLYVVIVGIIGLLVATIVPAVTNQFQSLTNNLPSYQTTVTRYLNSAPNVQRFTSSLFDQLNANSGKIATHLATATLGVFVSIFGVITVLILTAYFISGGKAMVSRALSLLPEQKWADRWMLIAARISHKLGYWLRGQFVLSLIIFGTHFIGLTLLGVPYALVLALIAGLFETIPTFGAWFAGILSTLVALTVSPGKAIAVAILCLLVQQIQGNIVAPQVMRRALGIPAVSVIISLLVFGKLFGLVGVLFAAPTAGILAILAAEFGPDSKRAWKTANNLARSEAQE